MDTPTTHTNQPVTVCEEKFSRVVKEDGFRLRSAKLFLTYKGHLDKDYIWMFLFGKSPKLKKAYIAHENADPTDPYAHTHVVCDLGKAPDWTGSRCLDIDNIHPNIQIVEKWKNACSYITKEDKTVILADEDRFEPVAYTHITSIWKHNTVQEALMNMKELKDALPTLAVFGHKPIELPDPEIDEGDFYPWQQELWNRLSTKPNNRKVLWVYDPIGNTGKTRFAKWCCLKHPEKCIMMNNVGKISDFAMNIQSMWTQGWRGNTVFLNLSRSYSDRTQIYEAIEMISDGYITCTKYKGGCVWLPDMHIVVMSNFEPQLNRLSEDRWEVRTILEGELRLCNINKPQSFSPFDDKI